MYEDGEAASARPAPCYRRVHPAQKVWLRAAQIWPRSPGQPYEDQPDGAQLQFEVLAGLTGKVLRADGGWIAEVNFQLHSANGLWHSGIYRNQLVPGHLLRWDRTGRPLDEDTGLSH